MDDNTITQYGDELYQAYVDRKTVPPLTTSVAGGRRIVEGFSWATRIMSSPGPPSRTSIAT